MDPAADWTSSVDIAITVCDEHGTITALNPCAIARLARDGGAALLGRNVFDCHPGESRTKIEALYASQRSNHYTISKGGERRIIHQLPQFRAGRFAGYVELSIAIPWELPHFDRH